ncbi:5-bromo-4-chloroindolyl phosphate hydrolysis family protein [Oceanobacillus damuensis]|uniref:5-bromo-4-chloroindolyl phosphate hydrolysis family protein n=1 Tax=Oceanobacillus damuensis TaxID=937928 RepID=UPI00082E3D2E|nr:5-bromo-4-chloroindolyl phosphate hydrolysis family protein [Oceanobacillus damuensis]
MRAVFQLMIQSMTGFVGTVATWLISFFAFEQTFLLSSLFAVAGGAVVYLTSKQMLDYRFVKINGLTRREYKFIENNLKDAKRKISRLQKALFRVRSLQHAKQNLEIARTAQKIYSNAKKEPKRFYQAEGFFYNHLDSLVELAEKYAYLSSQPAKTREMEQSLRNTRQTVSMLGETIKKDLHIMLDDDIDTLHFELDVAKQSINRTNKNNRRLTK